MPVSVQKRAVARQNPWPLYSQTISRSSSSTSVSKAQRHASTAEDAQELPWSGDAFAVTTPADGRRCHLLSGTGDYCPVSKGIVITESRFSDESVEEKSRSIRVVRLPKGLRTRLHSFAVFGVRAALIDWRTSAKVFCESRRQRNASSTALCTNNADCANDSDAREWYCTSSQTTITDQASCCSGDKGSDSAIRIGST